ERLLRQRKHCHVVYRTSKSVAFIRRDHVLNRKSSISQCDYDLIRFAFGDAWIVSALDDEQRSFDLCSRGQRRLTHQLRLAFRRVWIAHALVEELSNLFPVRR